MKYHLRQLIGMLLALCLQTALSGGVCQGRLLNPVTDINWSQIFPLRVGGLSSGSHHIDAVLDSSVADHASTCSCPSPTLGVDIPGVVISFHEPRFIEEVVTTPGCFISLGGVKLLQGYDRLAGELSHYEVHWYRYPVLDLLDLFAGFSCMSGGDFALVGATEIDPLWHDAGWAAVLSPEATLFANPLAQQSCMLDAVASLTGHPLDPVFWCAGSWGSVYPFTGDVAAVAGRIQSAELVGARYIAYMARLGLLWRHSGQDTLCRAKLMPIWVKSLFTVDPVWPQVYRGKPVTIGAPPMVHLYVPPVSRPSQESLVQVIFKEKQCCLTA